MRTAYWRAPDRRPARRLRRCGVHSTWSQYERRRPLLLSPILRSRPKHIGWLTLSSTPTLQRNKEAALSTNPNFAKTSRIFYGWFVVAGCFAVTFVGFGCVYSFSAFIESLQRDFGASRGSVSLVFSLAGFLYFSVGVVSGPLADRWGSRRMAVIGMLLIGIGLALAAMAQSLTEVFLAYGLGVGL